jgi:hypothetical protein
MTSFLKKIGMVAVAIFPLLASAALQPGKIETAKLQGNVAITEPKARPSALKSGSVFGQQSVVETNSDASAELVLSNGSTLLLSPDTRIEVNVFMQVASELIVAGKYQKLEAEPSASVTEIQLIRGKVTGDVRKMNAMSSYVVRTAAGMTRVRSGIFTVKYNPTASKLGLFAVSCVRGAVETTVPDSNYGPITVEPGTELSTAVGAPPATPAKVATAVEPTLPIRNVILAPVKILLMPISSESLAETTKIFEWSSLPPGLAKTIENMIASAPPEAAFVWNGVILPQGVTLLDGSKTLAEARGSPKTGSPSGPISTTTGGGGTPAASAPSEKAAAAVMSSVNRIIEKTQVISTAAGS